MMALDILSNRQTHFRWGLGSALFTVAVQQPWEIVDKSVHDVHKLSANCLWCKNDGAAICE